MNRKKIAQLLIVTSASCACLASLDKKVSAEPLNNKEITNAKTIEQSSIAKGQVVNVSTNLRIRQDASINSSIIGYLVNGDNFTIKSIKGDWYEIESNNKNGYVFKDYVKRLDSNNINSSSNNNITNSIKPPTNTEVAKNSNGQVINVSSTLRIRQAANISSSIVGYLNNGENFIIKGINGDWYQIEKGNKKGYIFKDYVKEVSSSSTPSTPNTNTNNNSVPSTPNTSTEKPSASSGQVMNVSSTLRVRQAADINSSIIGYLTNGCNVSIKAKSGNWYKIAFNNVDGYISSDYVKIIENSSSNNSSNNNSNTQNNVSNNNNNTTNNNTNNSTPSKPNTNNETQIGIVYNVSTNLRLRTQPNTSSASNTLAYIASNEKVTILSDMGDWYKVIYKDKTGYANKQYIKKYTGSDNSNSSNSNASVSKNYEALLNVMKSQIGSPYIFGGSGELLTPELIQRLKNTFPSEAARGIYNVDPSVFNKGYKAFDCSGLMQWSFRQIGINIGRTTWDQISNGSEVSLNNLRPGDLIFYSDLNHVGMYVGNGQWLEAPNSKSKVRITAVPWNKVSRARRILN